MIRRFRPGSPAALVVAVPIVAAIAALAAVLAAGVPRAFSQTTALAAYPDKARSLEETTVAFLVANERGTPVVHLDAVAIDSVGTAMSERNLDLAWRVQDAYAASRYGRPGSDEARDEALAAYTYAAETAFDFFLQLAVQEEVIYSTTEEDLKAAFTERFRNPGLYPIVNLKDFRAGFGQFCLEFEVDNETPREITVTGERMRAWTDEMELDGRRERVVNIEMKTMSHDRVHLVYRRYATGTVLDTEVMENGRAIRVATMEDVSGQFVRKWGLHRPAAIVLWRSLTDTLEPPPGDQRYLGSGIYFPGLQLKLPWFLPDLGFDDLRRFDFPQPLLTLADVLEIRDSDLEWLRVRDDLRFEADWEGEGDVPTFVSDRFPDQ